MGVSEELAVRARHAIPHGVNSPVRHYDPYPFFAERAEGCRMWDADGHSMIDMCNGYGALLLGHRHPDILGAVTEQMGRGTLYCTPTALEVEVSELVRGNYPSMEMSRMVNTGGEATMTAVRLARGYTGRDKIVMFAGGYHGAHDTVLVKSGSGSASMPASAGSPPGMADHTIVLPYNDLEGFLDVVESRDDIAGVIMEPVMANMGLIPPRKGFLEGVRHTTKQRGVVLIFDEVVTGFRMSPGGAQSYYGVRPDMTTLAKALGCGFAAAAVGGRRDIMECLAPGGTVYQASTFAGNPVAAAAAAASIHTINGMAGSLYPRLERQCGRLAGAVRDAAADCHMPCVVHHIASMMQVFFTDGMVHDYDTAKRADAHTFSRLFAGLLERGIFVAPSQFETAFLSAAHTDQDIDMVARAYQDALGAMAT
ncbi:MAG: glutamate-1-semialdehyde 2,1-aminomutase [Thaumarchaeota archaeon]|nr:glutamate-1-semialdehyde 2,1-aminomutase [Nitrososphaerota archaeon]